MLAVANYIKLAIVYICFISMNIVTKGGFLYGGEEKK
jgi:hypothetical protein